MSDSYPIEYRVHYGCYAGDIAAFWGFSYKGKQYGAVIAAASRETLNRRVDAAVRDSYKQAKEMYGGG